MVYTRRSARLTSEVPFKQHGPASSPTASLVQAASRQLSESCPVPSVPEQELSSQQFRAENGLKSSGRRPTRSVRTKLDFTAGAAEHITVPATAEDRQDWQGWCEIESEPAFFNVILRDFGVQDIKVQEVISLDEDMMAFIPKPVYGLIFLFQFQEDDPLKQEASCPDHVWFANQTISNACASIAMLNIVMNIPGLELGSDLESLKISTAVLSPALRGYQVSNDEFVRQNHNSFTRRMDMLNADLALSNEVVQAARYKKKSSRKKKKHHDGDEAGFHFVAYIPIKDSVWKLDGLEQQPTNLGPYHDDWMNLARPLIAARMQQYEGEQIQFNLLSLCRSPLLTLRQDLAANIQSLNAVEFALSSIRPDWQHFLEQQEENTFLRGPDTLYGVTKEVLDAVQPNEKYSLPPSALLRTRRELMSAQDSMRRAILDEEAMVEEDNERARSRRHDYTPMISMWIRLLAEDGLLKQLSEEQF